MCTLVEINVFWFTILHIFNQQLDLKINISYPGLFSTEALKLFGLIGDSSFVLMSALCVILQLGNLIFDPQLSSDMEEGRWTITLKRSMKICQLDGVLCEGIVTAIQIKHFKRKWWWSLILWMQRTGVKYQLKWYVRSSLRYCCVKGTSILLLVDCRVRWYYSCYDQ